MALSSFRYRRPDEISTNPRLTVDIYKSEMTDARVLVLDHAGETRLHSHPEQDAVWFVLAGRARFYDEQDRAYEVGTHEGVVVPTNTKYWFEAVGDEPLEIFRVAGRNPKIEHDPGNQSDMRSIKTVDNERHPHLPIEIIEYQGAP
jgi:mannose-6-phosphate isomerase-like protein (cupin superfamily)